MFPLLILLALPYFLRRTVPRLAGLPPDELGAFPKASAFKSAAGKGAGAGAGFLATPQGQAAATMALGPAGGMLLASPQGQAAVKKGGALAKKAAKGDPKAKKRIAVTKAKAQAGDPKAKKELVAIKAGAMLQEAASDPEGDFDEDEEYEDEGE